MAHESQPEDPIPEDRSDRNDYDDADSTLGEDNLSTTTFNLEDIHKIDIYGREYISAYEGACSCTPTDEKYQEMMDIKHFITAQELGKRLHQAPLEEPIQRVLDIGTGTGSWAIDLADEYPSAEVIGTDIAPIQRTDVPPNVQFELDDCERDWTWGPAYFDLVHVRNMTGNVRGWQRLFSKVRDCIRIGGFIESAEDSILFATTKPDTPLHPKLELWNQYVTEAGSCSGCSFNVVESDTQAQSMTDAGIHVIRVDRHWVWYSDTLRALLLSDLDGIFNFPAKQLGWSPEKVTFFLMHVRHAIKSQRCLYFRRTVVVGQVLEDSWP